MSFTDAENHRNQLHIAYINDLLECSSSQKLPFVVKANHSSDLAWAFCDLECEYLK